MHLAFQITLLFKGLFAISEIVAGIGAYAISTDRILDFARAMTRQELLEDSRDFVANYVVHSAQHLSVATQHFMGLYLLSHGVVKLALIVALLRKAVWAYPTAIAAFGAFILYQVYRYSITASPSLLFLTAVDLVVIALTWHEYKYLLRPVP